MSIPVIVRCVETMAGSTDEVDKVLTSALINCTTLLEMDSERKVGVVNTGDGVIGSWILVPSNRTAELELAAVSWVRNGALTVWLIKGGISVCTDVTLDVRITGVGRGFCIINSLRLTWSEEDMNVLLDDARPSFKVTIDDEGARGEVEAGSRLGDVRSSCGGREKEKVGTGVSLRLRWVVG